MLTVEILNKINSYDDMENWLKRIKNQDEGYYLDLITCVPLRGVIQSLKENKKCHLPSGAKIEIVGNQFKLTKEFDKDYICLADSIF